MEIGLFALVVAGAAYIVPVRLGGRSRAADENFEAEVAELEAAKEAKYREIRDAELDFKTGKHSEPDWRALDRMMRAEAVAQLKRLDQLQERSGALT